ncbi:MAG TPA: acyltransferase [Candidatus Angelobacter sp.]|nr:acyltransferase [Candidatus Angelobacter sp.]
MGLPSDNRPTSRVPEWDGIRGVAILLVVFFHYIFGALESNNSAVAHGIRAVFPLSWSGVDLFFVLSGFLIGGILMDQRESPNYFKTFYVRRVCRIVPVYFAWLVLFFVLAWAFSAAISHEWYSTLFKREIPHFPRWGYFLFLQNLYMAKSSLLGSPWLAATWSLAVEEQFYLLLPLMLWFIRPKHRFPVFIVLIALVPVFRTYLFLFHSGTFVYVLLPCRADALLLGALCACVMREPVWFSRVQRNRRWLQVSFVLLLLGVAGLTAFVRGRSENSVFDSFEMDTFGFTWIALFYACFLMLATTAKDGLVARVLRNRVLRHFGLIAYGMYLFHMAVDTLMHGALLGKSTEINTFTDLGVTALAFGVTWLLAVLSWNFFEKPIIRWGHSFSYGKRTVVAPEAVPLTRSESL